MERELIVRGEGQERSLPDRAVLRVTVQGEGSNRDSAYASAAADAKAVDAVLDARSAALDRVGHASLVGHPKSRWKKGESIRTGWIASRTTAIEVTGLDVLGELVAELTAAGADVAGPFWQLDPVNAAHSAARRAAASDARSRAEDYAHALGLDIAGIAWVAEPGLRLSSEPAGRAFAVAAAGERARGAAAEDVIDVSPAEMTVTAAVEVGFTISDGA